VSDSAIERGAGGAVFGEGEIDLEPIMVEPFAFGPEEGDPNG
jgi:hypothetical protein